MDKVKQREITRMAEEQWGTEAQKQMVVEECAELITAISHNDRGRIGLAELAEEVADVEIMLDFMRLYLSDDAVDQAKKIKLERLAERVKYAEEEM